MRRLMLAVLVGTAPTALAAQDVPPAKRPPAAAPKGEAPAARDKARIVERMAAEEAKGSATRSRIAGTFVATRIDREPLPLKDRVVDDDGTQYLIEFDRMVLALRADNTFRASVRYRRTLFSSDPRSRLRPPPLQNMTVTGTFEVTPENEIRFTPDPTQENRGLRMLAGTVRGARALEVPFQYRNGTQARSRVLVMTRNDNIL